MNPWKFSHVALPVLLSASLFIQQTLAISLAKDLVIATILTQLLKPRFVPLPIPLPFPLKFIKHTKKLHPVPVYSHGLSAHHVPHYPHDGLSELGGYPGGHDFAALEHLTGPHIGHIPSYVSEGHHDLTSSYPHFSGVGHDLSAAYSELPIEKELAIKCRKPHNIQNIVYDLNKGTDLYQDGSSIQKIVDELNKGTEIIYDNSNLENAYSKLDRGSEVVYDNSNLETAVGKLDKGSEVLYDDSSLEKAVAKLDKGTKILQDNSKLEKFVADVNKGTEHLYKDSNKVSTLQDDIEAIGGFDILSDLENLGESKKWWYKK